METLSFGQLVETMRNAADFIDDRSVRPIAAEIGFAEDQIRLFLVWFL